MDSLQHSPGRSSKSKESSHKKPSRDKTSYISTETADEYFKAKAFLMKASDVSSLNIYDHLKELIGKILEGRPDNVVDYVEELSIWLKKSRLQYREDTLLDSVETSFKYLQALKDKKLFQGGVGDLSKSADEEENEEEAAESSQNGINEQIESLIPDLQNHFFFLQQAGLTLNRNEVYRINLSIIKLLKSHPILKIRFWGKIIGRERNYVILESEFHVGDDFSITKDEEEVEDNDKTFEASTTAIDAFAVPTDKIYEDEDDSFPLPKPKLVPPLVVPTEPYRSGANQKVYFAALAPEFSWVKLPLVTPAQISTARLIRKYFVGRFDEPILSYPPFPGKEINYLRAQIARISAATQISPLGYYEIDPEDSYKTIVSEAFEKIPIALLVDDHLNNWVHHVPYLLPQGRVAWSKPEYQLSASLKDEDGEDEENSPPLTAETFEDLNEEEYEPETGPPLFIPIAEDSVPEAIPLWTSHMSPSAFPHHSVAVLKSIVWPGAYAIARDKEMENVYIGYGVKYNVTPYSPPVPPLRMNEYPVDDEDLLEAMDPSPEEEAVFKQTVEGSFVEGTEEEEEIAE